MVLLVMVMFFEWKTMKLVSSVTWKINFSMPVNGKKMSLSRVSSVSRKLMTRYLVVVKGKLSLQVSVKRNPTSCAEFASEDFFLNVT